MQIFQSAVQKLSLYPTRGKRTKINYRNSVAQYLALVKKYHLYIVSFCHWKWLAQKNSSKGTGFAEIWPPSPIYRAYRHGMGFRSRSARSFCTLTSPITFSIGVIQGSRTVCDDHMEPAHDWNTAQRALAIRGGKPRRRKWPLEETLHFPMNLNDFIVFVENLPLQIVGDICNCK